MLFCGIKGPPTPDNRLQQVDLRPNIPFQRTRVRGGRGPDPLNSVRQAIQREV
jgi:hypothetical protein